MDTQGLHGSFLVRFNKGGISQVNQGGWVTLSINNLVDSIRWNAWGFMEFSSTSADLNQETQGFNLMNDGDVEVIAQWDLTINSLRWRDFSLDSAINLQINY